MKDEIYLAPCLLCHSKNVKLVNHTGALQQNYKGIRCMDCGLATRTALFSINEIINQWNDSSHPPQTDDILSVLKEIYYESDHSGDWVKIRPDTWRKLIPLIPSNRKPPHEPCMVIYKPKEFIRELEQALNKKG